MADLIAARRNFSSSSKRHVDIITCARERSYGYPPQLQASIVTAVLEATRRNESDTSIYDGGPVDERPSNYDCAKVDPLSALLDNMDLINKRNMDERESTHDQTQPSSSRMRRRRSRVILATENKIWEQKYRKVWGNRELDARPRRAFSGRTWKEVDTERRRAAQLDASMRWERAYLERNPGPRRLKKSILPSYRR